MPSSRVMPILLIAVILLSAFPSILTSSIAQSNIVVEIVKNAASKGDSAFSPNPINVGGGDSVTWLNNDGTVHTVTSGTASDSNAGKLFDSKIIAPTKQFTQTFYSAGRYDYFCQLHPTMVGTVLVSNSVPSPPNRTWYVGEGANEDTYVKYRVQQIDTNDGRPFELTIYFKDKDFDGNWRVPFYVVDDGRLHQGVAKLGSNMVPLGEGYIPDDMLPYINGYSDSLRWLAAFTSESAPKSLDSTSWGKAAGAGGADIGPRGQETIVVQAGTYDTTVVSWSRFIENKIWILDNFPFPIKAEVYAEVASGIPPYYYKFELLETGKGEPRVESYGNPSDNGSSGEQTSPENSSSGTLTVEIARDAANKPDKAFAPNPIKVKAGEKVTWKNVDTAAHTVTSGKPSDKDAGKMFDSKLMTPKKEFSFKFDKKGTYDYYCQLHPAMVGQVVVGGGETSATSPSSQSENERSTHVEETQIAKNVKFGIAATTLTKGHSTSVTVKNLSSGGVSAYEFSIVLPENSLIKSAKAPKGWASEIIDNTIVYSTSDRPLQEQEKIAFRFYTNPSVSQFDWQFYDEDGLLIKDGMTKARIR